MSVNVWGYIAASVTILAGDVLVNLAKIDLGCVVEKRPSLQPQVTKLDASLEVILSKKEKMNKAHRYNYYDFVI
jgi:hypothetical protein